MLKPASPAKTSMMIPDVKACTAEVVPDKSGKAFAKLVGFASGKLKTQFPQEINIGITQTRNARHRESDEHKSGPVKPIKRFMFIEGTEKNRAISNRLVRGRAARVDPNATTFEPAKGGDTVQRALHVAGIFMSASFNVQKQAHRAERKLREEGPRQVCQKAGRGREGFRRCPQT